MHPAVLRPARAPAPAAPAFADPVVQILAYPCRPHLNSPRTRTPSTSRPRLTRGVPCTAAGLQTPKVVGTGVTTPRNKSGHASGVDLDDSDREPDGIRRTKRCACAGRWTRCGARQRLLDLCSFLKKPRVSCCAGRCGARATLVHLQAGRSAAHGPLPCAGRQRKPKHYTDMFIMTDQEPSVLGTSGQQRLQGICAPSDRSARVCSAAPQPRTPARTCLAVADRGPACRHPRPRGRRRLGCRAQDERRRRRPRSRGAAGAGAEAVPARALTARPRAGASRRRASTAAWAGRARAGCSAAARCAARRRAARPSWCRRSCGRACRTWARAARRRCRCRSRTWPICTRSCRRVPALACAPRAWL